MNAATVRGAHLAALDGWRGLSILLVLAAHLLPLGPKPWKLNYSAGILGMALFFTLSGFLITRALLREQNVAAFLIRRCSPARSSRIRSRSASSAARSPRRASTAWW